MLNVLLALFVVYVLATLWQTRRALATKNEANRLREAKILLFISALGVPILVGFILVI
jgi:uncharacterized membrane protein